jgi:hypothetical protein
MLKATTLAFMQSPYKSLRKQLGAATGSLRRSFEISWIK